MRTKYEVIYILDPLVDDAAWDADIEALKQFIAGKGGEVTEVQKWGRRRLAYEIGKKKEGIYTLMRFDADTAVPAEMNRRFRLNEQILRHLIVVHEEYTPPQTAEELMMGRDRDDRGDRHDRHDRHDRGGRGDREGGRERRHATVEE